MRQSLMCFFFAVCVFLVHGRDQMIDVVHRYNGSIPELMVCVVIRKGLFVFVHALLDLRDFDRWQLFNPFDTSADDGILNVVI